MIHSLSSNFAKYMTKATNGLFPHFRTTRNKLFRAFMFQVQGLAVFSSTDIKNYSCQYVLNVGAISRPPRKTCCEYIKL